MPDQPKPTERPGVKAAEAEYADAAAAWPPAALTTYTVRIEARTVDITGDGLDDAIARAGYDPTDVTMLTARRADADTVGVAAWPSRPRTAKLPDQPPPATPTRADVRARLLHDWADAIGPVSAEEADGEMVDVAVSVAAWACRLTQEAAIAAAERGGPPLAGPVVTVERGLLDEETTGRVRCVFCGYGPLPDDWHTATQAVGTLVADRYAEGRLCGFCRHGHVCARWLRGAATPDAARAAQDAAHAANVIRAEVLAR